MASEALQDIPEVVNYTREGQRPEGSIIDQGISGNALRSHGLTNL